MKDDLPYFSHDNDSRNHPKMKALRARFGWSGYGQFWALNEMIAGCAEARMDLSRKVVRAATACELGMTTDALEDFLAFLSNEDECGLINYHDGIVTTDRTQEDFSRVNTNRTRKRDSFKNGAPEPQNGEEKSETGAPESHRIEENREEENRQDENREDEIPNDVPEQATSLALLIASLHAECDQKYKVSQKQITQWAKDIEKLNRIDGRSWGDIESVIRWVKSPGCFWFPNIMSGSKLRLKFPTVWVQMNQPRSPPAYSKPLPVQTRTTFLDLED